MKKFCPFLSVLVATLSLSGLVLAQQVGKELPPWQEGQLDIHHINTGKGNAAFYILPDGTTMLIDAGAMDMTEPRTLGPRTTPSKPDGRRQPGEWIARYLTKAMAYRKNPGIDYALLTHFHSDHMGMPSKLTPPSAKGGYQLAGITQVGDLVKIGKMLDRGWPEYSYPAPLNNAMVDNYRKFLQWQTSHNGLKVERLQPGRNDQIILLSQASKYASLFEIRNIAANGEIWTGVGTTTRQHFPELKNLSPQDYPDENMCCLALRLSYGKFDYFTGGDLPGMLSPGEPLWHDVETPVAKAVGPVEVQVLDHHGNRDSQNEFFVSSLRPRVFIIPVWSSDHPGHDVLDRLYSPQLYPGERDVFATGMLESNKQVIGELLEKLQSDQGHIVVRVAPGGSTYQVIVLDDSDEQFRIKSIHGPYDAR